MKTKYIKVSVSDRIPEKEGDYFCVIANRPSIMTCRSMYFERFKGITHWLEEVPDYEDEILELMKKLDTELDFQDKHREMTGDLYECWDELKTLLTKLKTES